VVSLLTTEVHNRALAAYLSEQNLANENSSLRTATLEVLACMTFDQPCQAEIDHPSDADKRRFVAKPQNLMLGEDFAGGDVNEENSPSWVMASSMTRRSGYVPL